MKASITGGAGLWYGANWSSPTFLGIGERSWDMELENILLFLMRRVLGFEKYGLSCMTRRHSTAYDGEAGFMISDEN